MKKIVGLTAFLLIGFLTFAQDEGIRFGFQLSPTFSWMTANSNRINSSGTNAGLKMAMISEYYFRENYAFTSGIGFAFNQGGTLQHDRAGCYWSNSDLGLPVDTTYGCAVLPEGVKLKYKIQYLEIPLGLKMRTREFGYLRYYLEPAITIGINTQATGSVTGRGIGSEVDKINIKRDVNSFNLSWGLGGGLEYSISETTSLVGGIGFQVGFLDITEDGAKVIDPETGDTRQDDSIGKTHNITIRIGIMF